MSSYEHQLTVEFGGVSIGDETASVGISFERNGHTLESVNAMLCGKRLAVYAVVGAVGHPDQQQLPGIDAEPRPHIAATCDCAKFGTNPKEFSARLKFSLAEIDVKEIAGLAKRGGTLRLNVLGDVEVTGSDGEPDEDTGPDRDLDDAVRSTRKRQKRIEPAAVAAGNDPADVDPIEILANCGLSKKQCEKIRNSELRIKTVGDLIRAIGKNEWWHREIHGCGVVMVDKITDALAEYRRRAPAPDPDAAPTAGGEVATGGEECGTVTRFATAGDNWNVSLGITPGPQYRASASHRYADIAGGTDTPTNDMPAHATREEAVVSALGPIIDQWRKGRGRMAKAATALQAWAEETFAPAPNS